MYNYKELYHILSSEGMTARRTSSGNVRSRDVGGYKGLKLSIVDSVVRDMDNSMQQDCSAAYGSRFQTPVDIRCDVYKSIPRVYDMLQGKTSITRSNLDSVRGVLDTVQNPVMGINMPQDVIQNNITMPNLWISPGEASSLYSQKGLLETVINKKSKSILLNGLKIRNPRFKPRQIDRISENALRLNLPGIISSGMVDSLVYGGDLVFAMFKKDTPLTMGLPMEGLLRLGILGKHCIDRFISLDRWNTWIIPPVAPTQRDFLEPSFYFIPYMGCDVSRSRTARIITSPQAGWWGKIWTQGWGISDFCGYYKSYEQYKIVMSTMPYMIQQMSLLVRTVAIDGILATQGSNALSDVLDENQVHVRKVTPDNPVNMDVTGDLKAINRNFSQVPEMTKLLRQDFAADADIPEPMLFSSEKGNFSSGDDTQGNLSKQWENVEYIHKECETQLKRIAMIVVIDTLGTSKEVMDALPYTEISFDSPIIANATEKAEIASNLSKAFFDLVAGQMPMDKAAQLAFSYAGDDMSLSSELLEQLADVQKKKDEQSDRKFESDIKSAEKKIIPDSSVTVKDPENPGNTSKDKYSPLEQKQHEKTRIGSEKRTEGLARAEGRMKR